MLKAVKCEEESVLNGATVLDYGQFDYSYTPDPNELIGDGFKSLILCNSSNDMVDLTINFGSPQPIQSIFIEIPVF